MPLQSHFLPAERLSHQDVLAQATQVGESSVLIAMLDTVQGMVALLNPERQIVYCNDECARAGGLADKEDAVGMRPGELLHCIHAKDIPGGCGTSSSCRDCGLAQALVIGQGGNATSAECLLESEDRGRGIAAEYSATVTPIPQIGKGWLCYSLRDISSEKRRALLERTFFHDILNRASGVQGLSIALADDYLGPEQRVAFARMLSGSSRALVHEIHSQRTLLAAENDHLVVQEADCNSLKTLQEATADCRAFDIAESRRVATSPNSESILLRTDATLLGRILLNMLKNAIEASDAGGSVTATCKLCSPGCVRFSVHNEQVMPDSTRAHIFKRSFSTKGAGRGVGTYSIKLLTERYLNGRAWFESKTGHGTTFHVDLNL